MFETCPNFRDLGGYRTSDGRTVRRGRLFRAGTLTHLGADDHATLGPLGIRTICDLRHVSERDAEPTRWQDGATQTLYWDYRLQFGRVMLDLHRAEATPEDAELAMEHFYRELPQALAPAIRDIIATIAEGGTPLLFHCSAGKDRTGVVAGLLLDMLGVPRDTVLADYARSAELMDYEAILNRHPSGSLGLSRNGFSLANLPRPMRARVLASEPRYLSAMFAEVEARSGSVEAYIVDKLAVDPEAVAAVRAELLD